MKAARIENGVVADLWEVPSLNCFEEITLIQAAEFVEIGASYDGNLFVNPPAIADTRTYAQKRAAAYPPIGDQLDAMWKGGDAEIAMRKMVLAVKAQYPKP